MTKQQELRVLQTYEDFELLVFDHKVNGAFTLVSSNACSQGLFFIVGINEN